LAEPNIAHGAVFRLSMPGSRVGPLPRALPPTAHLDPIEGLLTDFVLLHSKQTESGWNADDCGPW